MHWLYHPVVHGIGQTQIIVQQVADMRQSVEKMVRIKQTLIEARKQKEEIINSTTWLTRNLLVPLSRDWMKPSNLLTSIGNNT